MTLRKLIRCLESRAEAYRKQTAWSADPRYTPDLLALAALVLRSIHPIDEESVEGVIKRALAADPSNICNVMTDTVTGPLGASANPQGVEMMVHPARAHAEERKHIISHKRNARCVNYGCMPYGHGYGGSG